MSTDKKVSALIEGQTPDFIRSEGPKFVEFMKAYYEFMEQSNNAIEVSKNYFDITDIDDTYDDFVEYFRKEIMAKIPANILGDKRLLAKHIKDLYRSRGSESSYRLLFRLLFNDNISFYYPAEDILRASDGRWVQENSIRVSTPSLGDINELDGNLIIGVSSGASAKVDKIRANIEGGILIYELFLSNISGTFEDGEDVRNRNSTVTASIINDLGPLQGVRIVSGGSGHSEGDTVDFIGAGGQDARGTVTRTSDKSAVTWRITRGGHGYRLNSTISIEGGSGSGAAFEITGISNTEVLPVYLDLISYMPNVVIGVGPTFVTGGANSHSVSSNLAAANSGSTIAAALGFTNLTVGTISSIATTNFGSGYTVLPTASVTDAQVALLSLPATGGGIKGLNAVITAENAPGGIAAVSVLPDARGSAYNKNSILSIVNTTSVSNTVPATGIPEVTGVISYPGSYNGTKGFLSWDKKLQDNYFYQEYSYVIKSETSINLWRKFVNDILHPAGTKVFSEFQIRTESENLMGSETQVTATVTPVMNVSFLTTTLPTGFTFTRSSNAYFFNANGVLQQANNNIPRFARNATTHEIEGIIIEGARTNYIRRNKLPGATVGYYGNTGVWSSDSLPQRDSCSFEIIGVTSNTSLPGFNILEVEIKNNTGITRYPGILLNFPTGSLGSCTAPVTSGTVVSLSTYFQRISGNPQQFAFGGNLSQNGAYVTGTGSNWTWSSLPTTLTRISKSWTINSAGTYNEWLPAITWVMLNGETARFKFAAPQAEIGNNPTSLIITETARRTRDTEVLKYTDMTGFRKAGMTFVFTGKLTSLSSYSGFLRLFSLNSGSSANGFDVTHDTAQWLLANRGAGAGTGGGGGFALVDTRFKFASAINSGGYTWRGATNGSYIQTGFAGSVDINLGLFAIGQRDNSAPNFGGFICEHMTIFSHIASPAELVTLSTL